MKKECKPYLAVTKKEKEDFFNLMESFKGEIEDKEITFPKDLGAEHPFQFDRIDKLLQNVGFVNGILNKIVTAILGDFSVKVNNKNAQALLNKFIKDSDFINKLEEWIKEALGKGNGFMELDLENYGVKVNNANYMYVKRNKKGKVLYYNQYLGNLKRFSITSKKFTEFKPNEIAHLKINACPGDAYGYGITYPNMIRLDDMLGNDRDVHKLIARKAGAPIHVKVGMEGEAVDVDAIDSFKQNLQYMNNSTEWVTDANVNMSTPFDFSNIGKNLTETQMYDFRLLLAGFNMSEVLMGSGQLNEGIAKVQQENFLQQIASWRRQIQTVIEESIFRPLLLSQNNKQFDIDVEFVWELESEDAKNKRLEKLQSLLNTFGISENMKRGIELEIANILELDDVKKFLRKPEKGADEEKEEEEQIKQPEVPGAKTAEKREMVIKEEPQYKKFLESECRKKSADMSIKEFINLKEMAGFNYSDYLIKILRKLKTDKFENLTGVTEKDFENGMLTQEQTKKLKIILKNGFKKNQAIREIEKEIKELNLPDRLSDGKVVLAAKARPNAIARTETVRLANEGLVDLFKENNIQRVRWLAALSDRTCPICENLNGRVFNIKELKMGESQPPAHIACRCSLISVIE